MRATGSIDHPVVDVARTYFYGPMRNQWDTNIDMVEHKKKIGVNATITYSRTVKKYLVAAREFIINYLYNEEEDGTVLYVSSSDCCEYQD